MTEFLIPSETRFFEQEIKKSRFLAWIKHIESPEAAKIWINDIASQYPDARHVCWAYIAGPPGTPLQSMSDAGEPSGTAGKPILNVLQHSGAGEIAAIVVRYFGGIKLGTGGLVRAYSSSASEALKLTTLIKKIPFVTLNLDIPFSEEHQVRHLLDAASGQIMEVRYTECVQLTLQLPNAMLDQFTAQLPHTVSIKPTE